MQARLMVSKSRCSEWLFHWISLSADCNSTVSSGLSCLVLLTQVFTTEMIVSWNEFLLFSSGRQGLSARHISSRYGKYSLLLARALSICRYFYTKMVLWLAGWLSE